jgi:hypothetical protein
MQSALTPEDAMNARTLVTRWITAGLAAAVVLSSASTAFADHGGRRYKGVNGYGYPVQRVVVHEHSSSAGPAIAGLIGGFILGAAVSSYGQPVVVHEHHYHHPVAVYRYYDPYGETWYDSLDECAVGYRHPRTIQVIDVRSGREVRTLCYQGGEWRRVSGDYDERDFDRGHDD